MQRLDEFRVFYNHTIHPELLRLERKRKRLLLLLFISVLLLIGIIIFELYLNILVLTLFLMIPIGLYISYLLYRIRKFVATFKPKVVNLILDFMDDGVNFVGDLKYDNKRYIPKSRFIASQIFASPAPEYSGEDFISGKIGDIAFEMSELTVREFSKVRNRLNYVFKGVFLDASFNKPIRGEILILPEEFRQYLTKSVKEFNKRGGEPVDVLHLIHAFDQKFNAYATPDAPLYSLLSENMQRALLDYTQKTEKEIYVSFIEREIFIGVTEPKDILEPHIFQSNVNFDLVKSFFEDIQLLINIVHVVDENF